MSDNISKKEIFIMKRKAKEMEEEVSDYEFGFEKPPEKKHLQSKLKKVFIVPVTKHRVRKVPGRRHSTFIETNNSDTNANESMEIRPTNENQNQNQKVTRNKQVGETEQKTEADQCVALGEKNENILAQNVDILSVKTTNISPSFIETNDDSIEFPLNSSEIDDLTLIENASFGESDVSCDANTSVLSEPLLFRNNYFKIIEEKGDSYRAMCLICGIDENNSPKQICTAKKNVSSNLITHLKVNPLAQNHIEKCFNVRFYIAA